MHILKVFYPAHFPLVADDCASFPAMHVTPVCKYPGMIVEVINNLATDSGFKIQPITALDYGFDMQNFTDINSQMFTMLENGDFDLLALPLQKTTPRERRFQFSNVLYNTPSRVLKREQRQKYDQTWSFFETYDSYTWISLGIAWLIQWLLCVTFRHVESRLSGQGSTRLSESAWQILRIQLLQPEQVPFRTKAGKFSLFLFSLVQCTLLLGIFSSFILASILHPKQSDSRNSMRMFLRHLRNKEYVLVTHNSQKSIFELINSSTMYPYANLKQAFENNPLKLVDTIEEIINKLATDSGFKIQPVSAFDYGFDRENLTEINPQIFEMLEKEDFDLLALPLQKTNMRERRFQFSDVLYNRFYGNLTDRTKNFKKQKDFNEFKDFNFQTPSRVLKREQRRKYDKMWSLFEIYDSYTWIALGTAWFVQWLLCVIFRRVESCLRNQNATRFFESAWQILRIQLLQPEQVPFRTKAGKFSLFLFSLVQCTLLLGIFSSFILASILHPKRGSNSMQTFLSHLKDKEYFLVTHSTRNSIFELINSSTMYPYANLKQALEKNPLRLVDTIEEAFDMVIARKAVMFQLDDDETYY
ncbi:hypothetical protein M3Y97_00999200 [Aphelenchoides bicaudatus]|nr:hypothetical protein M3Y97_00999200 [Aphelenchoides bicaudatus]